MKVDNVYFALDDLLSFCCIFVECRKKIIANVTWAKVEIGPERILLMHLCDVVHAQIFAM